jgi:hypothetical protein
MTIWSLFVENDWANQTDTIVGPGDIEEMTRSVARSRESDRLRVVVGNLKIMKERLS